jgi:hypothetical protein
MTRILRRADSGAVNPASAPNEESVILFFLRRTDASLRQLLRAVSA